LARKHHLANVDDSGPVAPWPYPGREEPDDSHAGNHPEWAALTSPGPAPGFVFSASETCAGKDPAVRVPLAPLSPHGWQEDRGQPTPHWSDRLCDSAQTSCAACIKLHTR